jgi:hypothetical protein
MSGGLVIDFREQRFRRDVVRLHKLGPRVLYELLDALGAERTLRTDIETLVGNYSRLDPATVALLADTMPPA